MESPRAQGSIRAIDFNVNPSILRNPQTVEPYIPKRQTVKDFGLAQLLHRIVVGPRSHGDSRSRYAFCSSTGRENTFLDQALTKIHTVRIVDMKQINGDPTDRRPSDEVWSLPVKVLRPFVPARVEQQRDFPRRRVKSRKI